MSDDRLLTMKEVAEILNVKLSWVKVRSRELPHVPLPGKYVRYRRSDIEAWIEQRREGGNA